MAAPKVGSVQTEQILEEMRRTADRARYIMVGIKILAQDKIVSKETATMGSQQTCFAHTVWQGCLEILFSAPGKSGGRVGIIMVPGDPRQLGGIGGQLGRKMLVV